MAAVIPLNTNVLLYRPIGERSVTVVKVAMYDSNTLSGSYGCHGITDGQGTSEIMCPDLDFVALEVGAGDVENKANHRHGRVIRCWPDLLKE